MAFTNVTGTILDPVGNPCINGRICFALQRTGGDTVTNALHAAKAVEVRTDSNGQFSQQLWVNDSVSGTSVSEVYYLITLPDKFSFLAIIPNSAAGGSIDIYELFAVNASNC